MRVLNKKNMEKKIVVLECAGCGSVYFGTVKPISESTVKELISGLECGDKAYSVKIKDFNLKMCKCKK